MRLGISAKANVGSRWPVGRCACSNAAHTSSQRSILSHNHRAGDVPRKRPTPVVTIPPMAKSGRPNIDIALANRDL